MLLYWKNVWPHHQCNVVQQATETYWKDPNVIQCLSCLMDVGLPPCQTQLISFWLLQCVRCTEDLWGSWTCCSVSDWWQNADKYRQSHDMHWFSGSFLFFYSLFADIFLRASSPVVDKTHSTALGSGDRAELSPDRAGLHRAEDCELTLTQVKFQQPLFLLPDVERCVSHIIRIICHLNAL